MKITSAKTPLNDSIKQKKIIKKNQLLNQRSFLNFLKKCRSTIKKVQKSKQCFVRPNLRKKQKTDRQKNAQPAKKKQNRSEIAVFVYANFQILLTIPMGTRIFQKFESLNVIFNRFRRVPVKLVKEQLLGYSQAI